MNQLSQRKRETLTALLVIFFCAQLLHTLFNVNNWPFCSYNMFNFVTPLQTKIIRVALHLDDGGQQLVAPGNILPLEFFKANSLIVNVYGVSADERRKEQLSEMILRRLNSDPWPAFDETYRAARAPHGSKYVGFDLVLNAEDYSQYKYGEELRPTAQTVFYSYRDGAEKTGR